MPFYLSPVRFEAGQPRVNFWALAGWVTVVNSIIIAVVYFSGLTHQI
ncbi:hypothetical protein SAMN02746009_01219 [Hymenobacter psychrotolerans DSM 18569]|uniref:Uncharacterized protein n=1 Tax=Hymenobacter psychrotolerans DSM 18569 TaxID=1121959 RepID=A0A1M6TTH0_9BACT|nr:hypothetical protein SAMN02746009_01219 [Hymenobacter psychrotolerans DSM 18569]